MEKTDYYKLNPNLNTRSRYCKYCKDHFWNINDCKSIAENGACTYCIKEGRNKINEDK